MRERHGSPLSAHGTPLRRRPGAIVVVCLSALALPALVSALAPDLVALLPLRAALILLFNLGCLGLGSAGFLAACTRPSSPPRHPRRIDPLGHV